jgi:phosphatidylglycerophosphate synthase
LVSLLFGLTASLLIIQDNKLLVVIGAILLFYKNVLDKVDGSLARAKSLDSRRGRFYDSISDFLVSLALFCAISYSLYVKGFTPLVFVICFTALLCSMLHCSYFIYYQVSLIKLSGKHTVNRLLETVTEEDLKTQDKLTLFLQRMFLIIYGWQDVLIHTLDQYQLRKLKSGINKTEYENLLNIWYYNKPFLTISSLLSIGSHMFFIALFAVIGDFSVYLILNLVLWNLLLFSSIVYHYLSTKNKIISLLKVKTS